MLASTCIGFASFTLNRAKWLGARYVCTWASDHQREEVMVH